MDLWALYSYPRNSVIDKQFLGIFTQIDRAKGYAYSYHIDHIPGSKGNMIEWNEFPSSSLILGEQQVHMGRGFRILNFAIVPIKVDPEPHK